MKGFAFVFVTILPLMIFGLAIANELTRLIAGLLRWQDALASERRTTVGRARAIAVTLAAGGAILVGLSLSGLTRGLDLMFGRGNTPGLALAAFLAAVAALLGYRRLRTRLGGDRDGAI
ncbi:MAG: hypothetical protein EXQ85_06855 [Alphaproteobacteria bacterium]|nr:hypothetical protein [Alphaproteobacteria bacterium]